MQLRVLQDQIATRAGSVVSAVPDWPCRRGCDHCCRHLAAIPQATPAEWALVRQALNALPLPAQQEIYARIASLRDERPVTCPFLDSDAGVCLIYANRPLACRTYGFYVERDQGLYCGEIKRRVDCGDLNTVVWGNQASIEAAQSELGSLVSLPEAIRAPGSRP